MLVLISFTSTSTWRVLRTKALASLAPHMTQICHTLAGHLVACSLLKHLRLLLLSGLATPRPAMTKTTLSATLTLAIRSGSCRCRCRWRCRWRWHCPPSCHPPLRPVQYAKYSDPLVSAYLLHILR